MRVVRWYGYERASELIKVQLTLPQREKERKVRKRQGRMEINRQVVQGAVVVKRKIRQGGQVGRNTDKPAEFVRGLIFTQQHVTKDVHTNKGLRVGEGCNETRFELDIYFLKLYYGTFITLEKML